MSTARRGRPLSHVTCRFPLRFPFNIPLWTAKEKNGIKGLTKIMILIIVKFLRPMVDLSGFNCNKVAVYVFDVNQPSFPNPFSFFLFFLLFLCLFLSLWPFQLYFIPWILPTTLRFLTLFFRSCFCLIGPFNNILFMKVFSSDIILCGWLCLKHQLTNQLTRYILCLLLATV